MRAARSAWQKREESLEAIYLWSGALPVKTERFWLTHPWLKKMLVGGYVSAATCFFSAALYAIVTNRFPYTPVVLACGQIFLAGVLAFGFFTLVSLLNSILEAFYRLRECGFFDAVRAAVSAWTAALYKEPMEFPLPSSGAHGAAMATKSALMVLRYERNAGNYDPPRAVTGTVLPPLDILPALEEEPPAMPLLNARSRHYPQSRGFAQLFGLHPAMAFLTVLVDAMIFGEEATAGILGFLTGGAAWIASLILSCGAGCVLGVIAYKAQRRWYGDDKDSALIKALTLGFLTALPFPLPLPAMLSVPAGIVGMWGSRKDDFKQEGE